MKKTGRKTTVFWVNAVVLVCILVLVIFKIPEIVSEILGPWLFAFVTNGAVYITGNVAYAVQRSRFYQEDLNEKKSG